MATLDDLRKASERVNATERELGTARAERDELIRAVRQSTGHTLQEIADAADVSLATVKTVVRGIRQSAD